MYPETQTERVVDAVVEGAYSFGVGLASAKVGSMIGAAVGSVIPGAGTVAGAAVGAAVGFVGGILVTAVADNGTKTVTIESNGTPTQQGTPAVITVAAGPCRI